MTSRPNPSLNFRGRAREALEFYAWGDELGRCTDRFGAPWLVNVSAG